MALEKKESSSSFVSSFLAITAAFVLVGVGALGFGLYQQSKTSSSKIENTGERESTPAADKEEPTVATEEEIPAVIEEEETSPTSDLEMLTNAFAEKYGRLVADTNVVITNNTGEYANGGVTFTGDISGGWWLAALKNGEWVIVADGNGVVMCADLVGYDFPLEMVSECWDESASQLVQL